MFPPFIPSKDLSTSSIPSSFPAPFPNSRQVEEDVRLDQEKNDFSEGLSYTDHAVERMVEPTPSKITQLIENARKQQLLEDSHKFADSVEARGITRSQIQMAIAHGEHVQQEDGRVMHTDGHVTVITDSTSKVVITTFHNRKPKSSFKSSKRISPQSKEKLRKCTIEMGTDADFSPNIKKAVRRVKKEDDKIKDQRRKKSRSKRTPRF